MIVIEIIPSLHFRRSTDIAEESRIPHVQIVDCSVENAHLRYIDIGSLGEEKTDERYNDEIDQDASHQVDPGKFNFCLS